MKIRLMLSAMVFSLLGAASLQAAPVTVPTGLSPGDQYRLAFVTSGSRDATSSDIADYNAFVQAHADAVPELLSLGVSWNAIGSTHTVDARDNTGTNPGAGTGVPIYLLNDTMLAADNFDLWDGQIDVPLAVDESGQVVIADLTWTGTGPDGIESDIGPLGGGVVARGSTFGTNVSWIEYGKSTTPAVGHVVFSMSDILTVAVPEPSSFLLLSVAGMGVIVGYPARARRRHHN